MNPRKESTRVTQIIIITIMLMFVISGSEAAAPPLRSWEKCFGGSLQDIPSTIIRLQNGNLLLLGNVDSQNGDISSNHGSTDIWLTETGGNGSIIWQKSIGGTSIDVGTSLLELSNGNLIISGYSSSSNGPFNSNHGNFDAFLISTDPLGNILWSKTYGGSQVDLCYNAKQTSDGGFILGGGSYSSDGDVANNNGDQDFWIIKTDISGNISWERSSGGSNIDVCYNVSESATGEFYASGASSSTTINKSGISGDYDVYVVKLSASGNVLWDKSYGGSDYETSQTLTIDSHNRILIGGYSKSHDGDLIANYGYGDSWFFQIDCTGTIIRGKTFGGSGGDNLYSILETSDGGYLLTSGSTSNDHDITNTIGSEDVWLLKVDQSLAVEWSHNYGGTGNDRPVSVIQNADGGFTVAGYTFSNNIDVTGNHGSSDIWIIELKCQVPSAFFSTNSTTICLGDTLSLADGSTSASEADWYFNNVFYSSGNSLHIPMTTTGFFQVALQVQTCYYSAEQHTDVLVTNCNLPSLNISADQTDICANTTVTFDNGSTNSQSYFWTFPGGLPATSTLAHPAVTYSQPGDYSVILTVTNSYGSQSSMNYNYITVKALASIPVITVTGNELISTAAQNYQWFRNSQPVPNAFLQSLQVTQSGYYTVQVQNQNLCVSESAPVYFTTSGINNAGIKDDLINISAYPNPATSILNVNTNVRDQGLLRILDETGKIIIEKNTPDGSVSFDVEGYQSGIYQILFINKNGKLFHQTFIKQ